MRIGVPTAELSKASPHDNIQLLREPVLRVGGNVERILEVQVLAQASGVCRIDTDVHQSKPAPVLSANAAEQCQALGNLLINVAHQLLRHLHS